MMATSTSDCLDPVMKKNIARMITAVEENNIDEVEELLRTVQWHKLVDPTTGNTILHISVTKKRRAIFHYLLSIVDFPIDQRNNSGQTVLDLCLKDMFHDFGVYDYFMFELIKRDAAMARPPPRFPSDTLFRHIWPGKRPSMCPFLVQMEPDVDERYSNGITLIWMLLNKLVPRDQLLTMGNELVSHPDRPTFNKNAKYNAFESAVRWGSPHAEEEAAFNAMMETYAAVDIHMEIFLILARRRSIFFNATLERARNLIIDDACADFAELIFHIDTDIILRLIRKFPDVMMYFFPTVTSAPSAKEELFEEMLLQRPNMLNSQTSLLVHRQFLRWFPNNEAATLKHITILLSRGVRLNDRILSTIFEQFGFGHLLKFVLRMDIEPVPSRQYIVRPLLMLLYDVNCDLEQVLERAGRERLIGLSDLLHYFCDARLRALCARDPSSKVVYQPEVPLLLDLVRNVCRKVLVDMFAIKTRREFYTLISRLPLPFQLKQIIMLETQLY